MSCFNNLAWLYREVYVDNETSTKLYAQLKCVITLFDEQEQASNTTTPTTPTTTAVNEDDEMEEEEEEEALQLQHLKMVKELERTEFILNAFTYSCIPSMSSPAA